MTGSSETGREVVFCADGGDGCGWFFHEADVMLFSLSGQVRGGQTAPGEALRRWEPYREYWTELYELDPEELEVEYGVSGFPNSDQIMENLPASGGFWHHAAGLGIRGAGFHTGGMVSNEIFGVSDEEALRTLRERLRDDYRIVAFGGVGGYTGHWSVEEAERRIEEARVGPVHSPTMPEL